MWGPERGAPEWSTQHSPAETPQVGQGTKVTCSAVWSRFLIPPLDSFTAGWSAQSCLSNASTASSLFSRLKAIFHEQLVQVYDASLEVIFHAILRCDLPPRPARIKAGRGSGSGNPATRIYPAQNGDFFSIQEPPSH